MSTKMPPLPVGTDRDTDTKTFRIPKKLVRRLEAVAKARGVSLNKLVVPFLEWACDQYEAENGPALADKKDKR